ncbi:acyl-CoA-binding domain-containing protein 5 [Polistes fuscatus]|uniref:acyl-CoA-binding domain-containing protein 5 n=1 Tax=Polistes fuscatus TaxID=30207 RepID=UPI001CA8BD0E|nr:acyl-CoA-binding domain-containing protein 5 [Polistes fuscatus]XP_043490955.1 acyl-CoA-binding domain-containing protein 5 [Polistes fuscatus]
MTTEEKFNAAVNVIRSLPKNGAYQPSNEIMLRFYSYYKQATEGPCQQPKPGFWEVIKKAKWDAWQRLGNMSRTEAMNNYVEELKKIVETMSYTDNVATFVGSLDSFYESVPVEDLELLVGPVLERMRTQPDSPLSGSPLVSRETSPHRVCNTSRHITSSLETSPASSHSASPLPPDTDGEEEEFIDTVESAPDRTPKDAIKSSASVQKTNITFSASDDNANKQQSTIKENPLELFNGHAKTNDLTEINVETKQERGRPKTKKDDKINAEFFNQIASTMQNLQRDLDRITARVRSLEGQALQALSPLRERNNDQLYPKWWPFPECSPRMFTLLIVWPFVAQILVSLTQRYRQRRL